MYSISLAKVNDLDVDKILVWNTLLPFINKPRISPVFPMMGSEWCLRFVQNDGTRYHVISLHQTVDGKMLEETKELQKTFYLKTYMMDIEHDNAEMDAIQTIAVQKTEQRIWFSDGGKEKIFQTLPWLYDTHQVKFAFKIYDHLPSSFQLQTETDCASLVVNEELPLRTEAESIQISSEVPRDMGIQVLSTVPRNTGVQVLSTVPRNTGVQVSSEVPFDTEYCGDFSPLLQKEILPDVTLECDGRVIRAHRCILGFRSGYFRAMFQNEMLGSGTGAVKIPDMDVGIFEMLVKFIYSGIPDGLSEECTADLYKAAAKYHVLSLKTACAYWILRNVNVKSCVKYLQMADSHFDCDLKAALISFIIKHPNVLKSPEWLTLSKELPKLGVEVFQTCFNTVH